MVTRKISVHYFDAWCVNHLHPPNCSLCGGNCEVEGGDVRVRVFARLLLGIQMQTRMYTSSRYCWANNNFRRWGQTDILQPILKHELLLPVHKASLSACGHEDSEGLSRAQCRNARTHFPWHRVSSAIEFKLVTFRTGSTLLTRRFTVWAQIYNASVKWIIIVRYYTWTVKTMFPPLYQI
jgi:hypothetical protein